MIDNNLLTDALGLKIKKKINAKNLGNVDDDLPDVLTFIDDKKYIDSVNQSKKIHALFTTRAISKKISNKALTQIVVDDPRYYYFELCNYVNQKKYKKYKTKIDPTARVHPTAFIAENNVTIGAYDALGGLAASFDVFDDSGDFIAHVRTDSKRPYSGNQNVLYFQHYAWIAWEDDEGFTELVKYKILK